ncbi:hypothetical protein Pcinc_018953 [Petrolisthes cinctipes]|uniref:Regulatory protein zeste n=1 Tax=Petrolisthes cinctipes TaxID=88211 RepID=A0AAE1KM54_PETCI|nr:hypothetical protein Pcinc_030938 [Petrolisthes cinctipes]KAK3876232.1 hypothetical protein Pcinc_018953 [Petrolisthes cinctipes]
MDTSPGKRQLQTNRNNSHNSKRQRSRNFTKYEKEVFYSLFREYEGIINNKAYSPESIRDAWSRLLVDYNSQQDVFPRTRRQLQVLWRDEKFRAKKKGRQDQQTTGTEIENEERNDNTDEREVDTNEERRTASFLSPLLAVIKQEQDALTAETTAAAVTEATTTHYSTSPSPDLYVNSNTEEGPSSPLPVETQLESCSSTSPLTRLQEEDDEDEVDEDEYDRFSTFPSHHSRSSSHHYHRPRLPSHDRHPSPPSRHWFPMHSNGVASVTFHTEEQEREYHRVRMTQLREEGAARLRLLEAELALYHQERHSRQQEHQLRMQILMEKLRKVRDGHT